MGRRRQQRAIEQALAQALTAGVQAGERRAYERVLLATAERVLGRELSDVAAMVAARGVSEALRLAGIAARELWPTRWREALQPVLGALATALTERAPLPSFTLANPRMMSWLDEYTSELAGNLSETSYTNFERTLREAQEEGLSVPDTAKRIRERLPEVNANRARLISQNELHRTSIEATHMQVKESGVPIRGKTWKTAGDHRVRPEHRLLDGVTVGLDEPFPNGAQTPGTEIGCRCVLTYDIAIEELGSPAA